MNLTFEERKQLEALSKEVFGRSDWYKKNLVKRGIKKTRAEIEASPNSSHYKYFFHYDEMVEYIKLMQTNAKSLLEEMKVDAVKNDLSK